jgi:hypothetical protein
MSVNLRTAPFAKIGAVGTVLSVAVPLAVFVLMLYVLWTARAPRDPLHISLLLGRATVLVLAAVLAEPRVSMAWRAGRTSTAGCGLLAVIIH